MGERIVCPLSMCTDNIKRCHPLCKLHSDNGECLIVEALKAKAENKYSIESKRP